jgi:hypothetical protein
MHPLPPDWQNTFDSYNAAVTRRQFFRKTGTGLGVAALASLLGERAFAANAASASAAATLNTAMTEPWKIAPKAKRAIYISLIGAPSQLDLFDYKPALQGRFKEDLKDWLAGQGERLTGMTAKQAAFPARADDLQIRATRAERHVDQRTAARISRRWPTTSASSGR